MSYDRKEYRRDRFERKQAYRSEPRSKKMSQGKMSLEEIQRMEDEEEMESAIIGGEDSEDEYHPIYDSDGNKIEEPTTQEESDGQAEEGK